MSLRASQVFAAMSPERSASFLGALAERSPAVFEQAVVAASAALKSRPAYLRKQSFEKRCQAVRRALSRVSATPLAEELLAVYFLECRKELLIEWLDEIGVEHEDGVLAEDAPAAPPDDALGKHVDAFRAKDDDPDRDLLLQAFAAQSSIDWPSLESLVGPSDPG